MVAFVFPPKFVPTWSSSSSAIPHQTNECRLPREANPEWARARVFGPLLPTTSMVERLGGETTFMLGKISETALASVLPSPVPVTSSSDPGASFADVNFAAISNPRLSEENTDVRSGWSCKHNQPRHPKLGLRRPDQNSVALARDRPVIPPRMAYEFRRGRAGQ